MQLRTTIAGYTELHSIAAMPALLVFDIFKSQVVRQLCNVQDKFVSVALSNRCGVFASDAASVVVKGPT